MVEYYLSNRLVIIWRFASTTTRAWKNRSPKSSPDVLRATSARLAAESYTDEWTKSLFETAGAIKSNQKARLNVWAIWMSDPLCGDVECERRLAPDGR